MGPSNNGRWRTIKLTTRIIPAGMTFIGTSGADRNREWCTALPAERTSSGEWMNFRDVRSVGRVIPSGSERLNRFPGKRLRRGLFVEYPPQIFLRPRKARIG